MRLIKILTRACIVVAGLALAAPSAWAESTLDVVKKRGHVICGVNVGLSGFSLPDSQGRWSGLDVDLTVALRMSEGALRRRTPEPDHWTIAPLLAEVGRAFERQLASDLPPVNTLCRHVERYRGKIKWSYAKKPFEAWCEGQTGYPLVDAGMRQLKREGWMHNRARLVVGSFLTKDLGIDWRWGERWFMRRLLDGRGELAHTCAPP